MSVVHVMTEAYLAVLCSSVSLVRGGEEEGVEVAACSLTCCLAGLHQAHCQTEQLREQPIHCPLHTHTSRSPLFVVLWTSQ